MCLQYMCSGCMCVFILCLVLCICILDYLHKYLICDSLSSLFSVLCLCDLFKQNKSFVCTCTQVKRLSGLSGFRGSSFRHECIVPPFERGATYRAIDRVQMSSGQKLHHSSWGVKFCVWYFWLDIFTILLDNQVTIHCESISH